MTTKLSPIKIKIGIVSFAIFIFLLTVPIPQMLSGSALIGVLQNAVHGPLFALGTCLLAFLFGDSKYLSYIWVIVFMAVLALLSEYLQVLTSRSVSWGDVKNNLFGIALGMSVWLVRSSLSKQLPLVFKFCCVLVTLISATVLIYPVYGAVVGWVDQQKRFPVLFDAQFGDALNMIESLGEDYEVDFELSEAGLFVLLLDGKVPGIVVTNFLQDWSEYETLVIGITNESETRLNLGAHVRDRTSTHDYSDRFNTSTTIEPGKSRKMRYDLADIVLAPKNRKADLTNVALIALYREEGEANKFIVTSISLE